jgi:hypothetical protein
MAFLEKMGLDSNVEYAERYTRLNDEPLNGKTKNAEVGFGHWKLGQEILKEGDSYRWITWTVENGSHVQSFNCKVTKDGSLIKGVVNCFALGWMPLDQGYLDDLFEEIEEDPIDWDDIIPKIK